MEDILNSSHIVASVLNTATQFFYIQIFISKHLIPRKFFTISDFFSKSWQPPI